MCGSQEGLRWLRGSSGLKARLCPSCRGKILDRADEHAEQHTDPAGYKLRKIS